MLKKLLLRLKITQRLIELDRLKFECENWAMVYRLVMLQEDSAKYVAAMHDDTATRFNQRKPWWIKKIKLLKEGA